MTVNINSTPYTDTGTGAYPNPPTEVSYENIHDPESTGAVEGPPAEVTYDGELDLTPTGAHPNPPAEVVVSQFDHAVPAEPAEKKTPAKAPKKKGN